MSINQPLKEFSWNTILSSRALLPSIYNRSSMEDYFIHPDHDQIITHSDVMVIIFWSWSDDDAFWIHYIVWQ